MDGRATIVNYNANAAQIVASAGRISTTKGSADEIYRKACETEDGGNERLIQKILQSGHESVLEHISLNLSFDNVSVFVEQFMIEFRLASFTVKSRRYVDFGQMGYFRPDFSACGNADAVERAYREQMEFLFGEYDAFLKAGVPKEDARFLLPYSFRSNFYCTMNAREFRKVLWEMLYGRGSRCAEIRVLGESLRAQCAEGLSYLVAGLAQENADGMGAEVLRSGYLVPEQTDALAKLVGGTEHPERVICQAAALSCGRTDWLIYEPDEKQQKKIFAALLKGRRKRELEQASFTILFPQMSLAGVTHLVRHRMQSIVVPDFLRVCSYESYVLPQSIQEAGLTERYRAAFEKTREAAAAMRADGLSEADSVYLLLSGMTVPVLTTMNANELVTFLRLRTCTRAQWEIKACADELLARLREKHPALFSLYGPTCYLTGKCPEGKMTCGRKDEICAQYRANS